MRSDGPVRVLIVDQSMFFCRMLAKELNQRAQVSVVGKAHDALQARGQILRHRPDVIILELELGGGDGLNLIRDLRAHYPVPIIVCSSGSPRSGPRALKAVALGALDVVAKPDTRTADALRALGEELAAKIRMAAREARPVPTQRLAAHLHAPSFRQAGLDPGRYLVAIGASTGGTEAVRMLLANAPADFPPVVIVQHMPAGFTQGFAQRLDQFSAVRVSQAREGDIISPGRAVVARGDTHLIVRKAGPAWRVHYTDQRPVNRHCPSVNVLFASVAAAAGPNAVGILLTGMGVDGARGLLRLREQGAVTIAQDRASCVVYGMPKAAAELGAVTHTACPQAIPGIIPGALLARVGSGVETSGPTAAQLPGR